MMVESDINEAQSFNYLPHMKRVKATSTYIMHNLRELLVRYPLHFQAVFVKGRKEMARAAMKVLAMGERVKRVDLQLGYEKGEL
jgi:hypothetical protein